MQAHAVFAGLVRMDGVSLANRGLQYGDGLFETLRVHRGEVPLWPRHLARLREGAARLGIAVPEEAFVEARIAELVAGVDAGVLKLLLTRGDGGRGYAPPAEAAPVWTLARHPLPAPQGALRLHLCETRLAVQPALAGIKHCNRLEQVLARAEAERAGGDEGLVRDTDGVPVCATSANVLVLRDGRWWTPPVARCGVAGVAQPEVALVQGDELGRQKAHLAGQLHVGLAQKTQALGLVWVERHDRLGPQRAVLGAAEGEQVDAGVGGERGERLTQRRRGAREPGAVQMHDHAQVVGVRSERSDLGGRV